MKKEHQRMFHDLLIPLPINSRELYKICQERCGKKSPRDSSIFRPLPWATKECEKCKYRLNVDEESWIKTVMM